MQNEKIILHWQRFNHLAQAIDWTIQESLKAKLKVIVKRTLRKYGYSPDMQNLPTDTVLKQAELIAEEITQGK